MIGKTIDLYPAYGRDYDNDEDARNDYLSGKDFRMFATHQYCSIRDFTILDTIRIWYGTVDDEKSVYVFSGE